MSQKKQILISIKARTESNSLAIKASTQPACAKALAGRRRVGLKDIFWAIRNCLE